MGLDFLDNLVEGKVSHLPWCCEIPDELVRTSSTTAEKYGPLLRGGSNLVGCEIVFEALGIRGPVFTVARELSYVAMSCHLVQFILVANVIFVKMYD